MILSASDFKIYNASDCIVLLDSLLHYLKQYMLSNLTDVKAAGISLNSTLR